jgi:hypothetical protein
MVRSNTIDPEEKDKFLKFNITNVRENSTKLSASASVPAFKPHASARSGMRRSASVT